jgi:hypothetical protein
VLAEANRPSIKSKSTKLSARAFRSNQRAAG